MIDRLSNVCSGPALGILTTAVWLPSLAFSAYHAQWRIWIFSVLFSYGLFYDFDSLQAVTSKVWSWQALLALTLPNLYVAFKAISLPKSDANTNSRADIRSNRVTERTQPVFYVCDTHHARLGVVRNAFRYSYLLVGFEVGFEGNVGRIFSAGRREKDGKPWTLFDVPSEPYLSRYGGSRLSLRQKLDHFLKNSGHNPDEYPTAYLVTSPRFLGYSFNPVSFWYLYDRNLELQIMILDVNNTFDERHMYICARQDSPNKFETVAQRATIKYYWPKEFHVSPFFDRTGGYRMTSSDPLHTPQGQSDRMIDAEVHLFSELGGVKQLKLTANIRSKKPGICARSMSSLDLLRFVVTSSWIGFLTFPRIVYQAAILHLRLRLPIFWRPEVRSGQTSSRKPTFIETELKEFVLLQLERAVTASKECSILRLRDSGTFDAIPLEYRSQEPNETAKVLTIDVLSPRFYQQLVAYHSIDNFASATLNVPDERRTYEVSDVHIFLSLLAPTATSDGQASGKRTWRFRVLQSLRTLNQLVHRVPPSLHSRWCQNVGSDDMFSQDSSYMAVASNATWEEIIWPWKLQILWVLSSVGLWTGIYTLARRSILLWQKQHKAGEACGLYCTASHMLGISLAPLLEWLDMTVFGVHRL